MTVPSGLPEPLQGFRIGVTSDRRAGDLIAALERRGAEVLHAPSLRIAVNESDSALVRDTSRLIEARPELVLITTGYGMQRWLEVADVAGLGAELIFTL
ncbi:MAG TPA: uroporphyrinogen-III synthase, partial [Microlunatus sp.]|nr:uroporphyrinogen-III synthase [Microlunatus sp.]